MMTLVFANLALLVIIAALAYFFAPADAGGLPRGRAVWAMAITYIAATLSGIAWFVFIVAHFVGKYW